MSSEVARLKKQIETEIQAARLGLYGYKAVSSHTIINRAFEQMEQPYNQLASMVGPDTARKIVGEMLEEQIVEKPEKPTLLSIKQKTTVKTKDIAELAKLSIGDVYAVEIGGFAPREKANKVVRAFCVLSGIEINIEDIRLNSSTLVRSYR